MYFTIVSPTQIDFQDPNGIVARASISGSYSVEDPSETSVTVEFTGAEGVDLDTLEQILTVSKKQLAAYKKMMAKISDHHEKAFNKMKATLTK